MKKFSLILIPTLLCAACGSTTTTYDPNAGGLRTMDAVNYDDFVDSAGTLIQSMLASGSLNEVGLSKHEDGRIVLALEDVDNLTSSHINTKVLTDKVRISLSKTGRVVSTTAVKFGRGAPDDVSTKEVRELDGGIFEENPYNKGRTVILPDLSLSGSIIKMSASEGRTKETVLIFKLTLTDLRTGLAIWEDEAPIGKRKKKGLFG